MKKAWTVFLSLLMILAAVSGSAAQAEAPLKIVTTIFPPYDFVRQIAGDTAVEVQMLLQPGAESHSFEPTPQDIIAIERSDIFIHAGGEGDAWVDRILESMDTSSLKVLTMTDMVQTVDEELVEGMEHGHEEHDHSHGEFDPEKVYPRELSEWTGSWMSLAPKLADGSLDEYVRVKAEEAETGFEEHMEGLLDRWRTDAFDTFMIAGDKLYLDTGAGTLSGTYTNEGFTVIERDDGSASVWYQYQLAGGDAGMPRFIAINDHGYGVPPQGEDGTDEGEHGDDGHDHSHGVAHTHFKYGDESVEATINMEGWNPFFVDAIATNEQILDTLLGHGSSSSEHGHEEHAHMDEHVWTAPMNAAAIVLQIADVMAELDSANAAGYTQNADAYIADLQALDAGFSEVTKNAARDTIVFGDRFPFRYLADAYGLTYYAAFTGCSTQTDASAATIAFLIDKVQAEELPVVFKIELSNGLIAQTIAESTGAKVLELNSAHNLPKADFDAGVTYLDIMWQNVQQLKEALQ